MKAKLYPDLKCPNCGSDRIQSLDMYDRESAEIEGVNALVEQCIGTCRKCGKRLQWEQAYTFVGFRNIFVDEIEQSDNRQ